MKHPMIDTHCHLYSEGLIEQADEIITRARDKGIDRFYLPAIDSSTHEQMIGLETRYHSICHAMMGLHPCSVTAAYNDELAIVKEWLGKRPFVAIGEIGLDYYWDTTFKMEQQEAFRIQIDWALERSLPISIHTRNAMDDTISIVEEYVDKGLKGIFHCFSGTAADAERILKTGFYFGLGGVLTYKNSGLADAIADVPIQRMVLETDAPYLAPVPFRGKRNDPATWYI
jgi:TatD DNase family protein